MSTSTIEPFLFPGLTVNGSIIGVVVREAIRRARVHVQACRTNFEVSEKARGSSGKPNFFTTADTGAQERIAKVFTDCFPGVGIIGEEGLNVPCSMEGDVKLFWVIDPVDGTIAFIRGQGSCVGIMIALVAVFASGRRRVIAAYIGDAMNNDVIGFRPESEKVHHIQNMAKGRVLNINPDRTLRSQYALLAERPEKFGPTFQYLFRRASDGGLFKDYEKTGGSIGMMASRLANGEVGAIALTPHDQTPWDTAPIMGILQQLGFLFLHFSDRERCFVGSRMWEQPPLVTEYMDRELLIIHHTRLGELRHWLVLRRQKKSKQ